MRGVLKWLDKVERPGSKGEFSSIHSVCYSPHGTRLVVAAGERVLIYGSKDGTLLNTLKAHKDVVNCVAYAKDGKKFASGGADKTVIVWSHQLEGLLKYSHGDSVQCMSFNPVTHHLASCSISDFAFWSTDQKAVQKYKIHSRINGCCWTSDGEYLILGLSNGTVSIRNKSGEEKGHIDRPGGPSSPVYAVQCASGYNDRDQTDIITVADWSQTLSFYTIKGQLIGKERALGFKPLCITYASGEDYCFVAGCTGLIHCFSRDGIRLSTLGDTTDTSWIWSVAVHPDGQSYTVGCQNGQLICYNIAVTTVHALYRERYTFREHMCDVIIQHLITGEKVRIKCRDFVQKIAIYRQRLAVQLPERIVLYELNSAENEPMHYAVKEKILKKFDCSLLVVCARHIVLCQDRGLQCLDFKGVLQRQWIMDALIRYIKVIGGPSGREGLMVGLKNGEVHRIFLDNASSILITTTVSAVRCLDVNANRTRIAVVDDDGRLVVRDIINDTLLFQDSDVNSVAWNTHHNTMLCYTHTTGGLSIRVGNLPPRVPQHMLGVIVGLSGSTAFCLWGNVMHNVPLALGVTMWQFVEAGLFEEAFHIACLGVTNSEWLDLAKSSLEALHFNIARNAYVKLRKLPWLQIISELTDKLKTGTSPKEVLQATFYACSGQHKEAARLYDKCNQPEKALAMYIDLRMFDLAQDYARGGSKEREDLIRRRAEWAYSLKEPRAATELLLSINDYQRAIEIVSEQGWADVLYDIGRRLDPADTKLLQLVATNLKGFKVLPLAAEVYQKLGDDTQVVHLHIEAHDWSEAFRLSADKPQLLAEVHFEHAKWLAENDHFIEAHEAYLKSGHINDANRLLKQLSTSAIEEDRFLDASYFYWLISEQYLGIYHDKSHENNAAFHLKQYTNYQRIAKIYYAYSVVSNYMKKPFTTYSAVSLFNVSRYIMNEAENQSAPRGVSMFSVLFTLAKQAKSLQANKLCLIVNKLLQALKPPAGVQEQIDINYLNSKACKNGFNDPEELLPLCYKCSNYSQHLNGNVCPTCKQNYVFSFISFEILPLVRFYPEVDITHEEAERLLRAPPNTDELQDPFNDDIATASPLSLDRPALRAMDPNHIIIIKSRRNPHNNYIFYRNILPDLQITYCPYCLLTFYAEDFELQVLKKGSCPFCRTPADKLFEE